jgi:plasmid maintenance system antidote protein VapI
MAKSFDALVRRTTTKTTRDKAARRTRELLGEMVLAEIRKLSGKTQRDVAGALGIRQPTLSKLENQPDMQVTTLQRIVRALGGELDLIARFPSADVRIGQFRGRAKGTRPPARGKAA